MKLKLVQIKRKFSEDILLLYTEYITPTQAYNLVGEGEHENEGIHKKVLHKILLKV